MDALVFSLFSSLPLELRGMIWSASMPSDGPVMYPFGDNFLTHTVKTPEAPGQPGQPTRLLVQLPTPTALFVCREARQAAERWMASLNAWLYPREETQGHIVVRDWRQQTDLLYVPREKWRLFANCMFNGAEVIPEADFHDLYASVRNLVLPAFTAYYSVSTIAEVMDVTFNLASVHVLWGNLPQVRATARYRTLEAPVQPRWVVEVEDSEEVLMCARDESGVEGWETGELEEWMFELEQELAIQEVPPQFVNDEGEVTVPIIPVRMKKD